MTDSIDDMLEELGLDLDSKTVNKKFQERKNRQLQWQRDNKDKVRQYSLKHYMKYKEENNIKTIKKRVAKDEQPYGNCVECKKEFPYKWKRICWDYRQRFCGSECRRKSNSKIHFKGGHVNEQGYVVTTVLGRPTSVHRLVMEQHLGRKLKKNETVHHIDGNRQNNKLSNLELRIGHHGKHQRLEDLHKIHSSDYIRGVLSMGL